MKNFLFEGRTTIIPLADIQHVEKYWYSSDKPRTQDNCRGITIVTKHTCWDVENDAWANNIYLDREEADEFLSEWTQFLQGE